MAKQIKLESLIIPQCIKKTLKPVGTLVESLVDQSEGAQRCKNQLAVTGGSQGGSGLVGGQVSWGCCGGGGSLPVATTKLLVAMDKLTGR